ncbi:MAG TPA: hypothetical protein VJ698_21535 [Noviherbaspirillum sp.]|uniref:hypothetical protein n=1 Tax=Noviherbaspirillum sp. TaxID=1926288 RepID=UPI002B470AA0|nr:hypothetical protein [Noviherbaspirillum sp.]HJV88067.1 hypothetical protein [Noviherbaspirillum sp.]
MNRGVTELPAMDEFILGDQQLHTRFSMAIEILARSVIVNPRPVTTSFLSQALGQPSRTVRALLAGLHQSGLVWQDENDKDAWYCTSTPGAITLADIFRSVCSAASESVSSRRKPATPDTEEPRNAAQQNVELLLMQATMEINQMVLQHLQAFDLGRLKAIASPGMRHSVESSVRTYIPEPLQELM